MNQNAPQPSFELPMPQPAPEIGGIDRAPESLPARPEQGNLQPAASTSTATTQSLPVLVPIVPPAPTAQPKNQPVTSPTPLVADDADLIEKEWVIKAKQIVAATSEDPYTQNREISKFKADYLKKRYNKDIKVEES